MCELSLGNQALSFICKINSIKRLGFICMINMSRQAIISLPLNFWKTRDCSSLPTDARWTCFSVSRVTYGSVQSTWRGHVLFCCRISMIFICHVMALIPTIMALYNSWPILGKKKKFIWTFCFSTTCMGLAWINSKTNLKNWFDAFGSFTRIFFSHVAISSNSCLYVWNYL